MQPMRDRSVVFPEPLGPFKTVTLHPSRERVTPSTAINALDLPRLNPLRTFMQFYHSQDLMTESGSTIAALQEGTMVATV